MKASMLLLAFLFSFVSAATKCPFSVDNEAPKPPRPSPKAVDPCPKGWTHLDMGSTVASNCYIQPPLVLNWDRAYNHCQSLGGELMNFKDSNEYTRTLPLFTNSSTLFLTWTSLKLQYEYVYDYYWDYYEWLWEYIGHSYYYGYAKWSGARPPQDGYSNCSAWRTTSPNDGLVPTRCHLEQPFLCKQQSAWCPPSSYNPTTGKGTITSTNFPDNYDNDLDCIYYIKAPSLNNTFISITFEVYEVEERNDYVTLFDGPNVTSPEIATICKAGTNRLDFESTGPYLTLLFHTDYSMTKKGWKASYTSAVISPPIFVNDSNAGEITSPNYPDLYPNLLDQLYYIVAADGFQVNITFDDFFTEKNYDVVTLFDAPQVDYTKQLGNLTGQLNSTVSFLTTTNTLTMRMMTDYAVNKKGFHAFWTVV